MKRGTVIAIVTLVLVLVAFFATRKPDTDMIQSPFVIKHVEDLNRIELTRPGNESVTLEKSDAGWSMTKPIHAPISEAIAKELDTVFATEIRADGLRISKDKLDAYELTPEKSSHVALFAKGATAPAVEFMVGKEMSINDRLQRSFIKTDKGNSYRAQRSLEVLRQPVDVLRSKTILSNDRALISAIKITTEDGVIALEKSGDNWQMTSPLQGMALENSVVQGAVSLISRLQATGFADDKNPAEIRLDPPRATVSARVGDSDMILDVTHVGKDWYVRKRGDSVIYTIGSSTGNGLVPDLNSLRDRLPLPLVLEAIQTIEFLGAQKIIVTRNGESWTMLRPSKKEVKRDVFSAIASTLAALRVARYEETTPEKAGLDMPAERIILRSKGVKTQLLLGARLEGTKDRYGKWDSLPLIFIIPGDVAERLLPTIQDLIDL